MMSLFASDIMYAQPGTHVRKDMYIDIGVIKHARFLDKSIELRRHYPEVQEIVYITGFDTLVRILEPKYYPESYTLDPLDGFFERNRIKCTVRCGDLWGDQRSQVEYIDNIKIGRRVQEGCKPEWAEKIELLENKHYAAVSSTKVRNAAKIGDAAMLKKLLTRGVGEWVLEKGLYKENEQV